MISFVCWKWRGPRLFESEHVNVLRAMLARHYAGPHRLICITDDPDGLDPRIETMPQPVTFEGLEHPLGPRFPSCWRRLWNFSADARMLGERIMALDIDVIITGDVTPLVARNEDFVGWCDERFSREKIAGGIYLLRTGSLTDVWDSFDPETSPSKIGGKGTDTDWITHKLYPLKAKWTARHGIVKPGWLGPIKKIPKGVRIVSPGGHCAPWLPVEQKRHPWILDHWKL